MKIGSRNYCEELTNTYDIMPMYYVLVFVYYCMWGFFCLGILALTIKPKKPMELLELRKLTAHTHLPGGVLKFISLVLQMKK